MASSLDSQTFKEDVVGEKEEAFAIKRCRQRPTGKLSGGCDEVGARGQEMGTRARRLARKEYVTNT